mgnify:CR=1 FL=1
MRTWELSLCGRVADDGAARGGVGRTPRGAQLGGHYLGPAFRGRVGPGAEHDGGFGPGLVE